RMEGLVFSTLGELRARADWAALGREYHAGAVPSTPLGELDASFWGAARPLANLSRFGGHTRAFYSVAQHSVIVSQLVEERGGDAEDAFAALMHDATEAYLGDMPHPIKHRSPLGAAFK